MTYFNLKSQCSDSARLRDVHVLSHKQSQVSLVGFCGECNEGHKVERRTSPSTIRTNTKADPRNAVSIDGTAFKLSVPFTISQRKDDVFKIGNVRFQFTNSRGNAVRALDPIPASWLVDLSADAVETQEEEFEGADLL